jgi:hypothetical protein
MWFAERGLELLVQLADLKRPHDVGDPFHQRPDPGEDEEDVGLLDDELACGSEREDRHQEAGDEGEQAILLAEDSRSEVRERLSHALSDLGRMNHMKRVTTTHPAAGVNRRNWPRDPPP